MTELGDNLEHLTQTYLHQDWDLEGDSLDEVLRAYREAEGEERARGVAADAEALARQNLGEDELAAVLAMDYPPSGEGLTYAQFLARVAEIETV